MTFDKARTDFEFYVTEMQEDVKLDFNKIHLSAKAKEYRLARVNALVDFYGLALEQISELQLQLDENLYRYNKLHEHAQRLVLFCQLHDINPNMIFHYSIDELKQIYDGGIRFTPAEKRFDRMIAVKVCSDNTLEFNYAESELTLEKQAMAGRHHNRYLMIKQLVERRSAHA